jgi:hypothetical protein
MDRREEQEKVKGQETRAKPHLTSKAGTQQVAPPQLGGQNEPQRERPQKNRDQAKPCGLDPRGDIRLSEQWGPFFQASIPCEHQIFKEESIKRLFRKQLKHGGLFSNTLSFKAIRTDRVHLVTRMAKTAELLT